MSHKKIAACSLYTAFFLFINNTQASFQPADAEERFEERARRHQNYAETEGHFASIGAIIGSRENLLGTATLFRKNNQVITAAHVLQLAASERILHFRLPHPSGSVMKAGEYTEYKIGQCHIPHNFARGGPDIGIAVLENEVTTVTPVTLGMISNPTLFERLAEDERKAGAGYRPEHFRYRFSSATVGGYGPWDEPFKRYTYDGRKRGFNCYLFSQPYQTDDGAENLISCPALSQAIGIDNAGGGSLGSSGAPLFIQNIRVAEPKWRLIGVLSQTKDLAHGDRPDVRLTIWSPFADLPDEFLRTIDCQRSHT